MTEQFKVVEYANPLWNAALKFANDLRTKAGLQPVESLYCGVKGDVACCVIAATVLNGNSDDICDIEIDGNGSLELQGSRLMPCDDPEYDTFYYDLGYGEDDGGNELAYGEPIEVPARFRLYGNDDVEAFITAFDEGAFPTLQVDRESFDRKNPKRYEAVAAELATFYRQTI